VKTYSFDGIVTAVSSIMHNGGEQNGIATQLRREKFVQPSGKVERVPVISGNAIRGILRDVGMADMLRRIGYGDEKGLPLNAFYFLFSGGALSSTGAEGLNVGHFRTMKELIPLIGLFGGAIGNAIMPGKLKIGKLIPICAETMHLLPESVRPEEPQTIWDYCQTEMYTRKDDEKNDKIRELINAEERKMLSDGAAKQDLTKASTAQQMMYRVETLAAGTQFYWKITLDDPTDIEFEAFLTTMLVYSKTPYLGGRSAVGHGEIAMKMNNWVQIDSRFAPQASGVDVPLGQKYSQHLQERGAEIRDFLEKMK
jgi:CRISPR type IV-associated protein Csf2